jgi:hypothetical protein
MNSWGHPVLSPFMGQSMTVKDFPEPGHVEVF